MSQNDAFCICVRFALGCFHNAHNVKNPKAITEGERTKTMLQCFRSLVRNTTNRKK